MYPPTSCLTCPSSRPTCPTSCPSPLALYGPLQRGLLLLFCLLRHSLAWSELCKLTTHTNPPAAGSHMVGLQAGVTTPIPGPHFYSFSCFSFGGTTY